MTWTIISSALYFFGIASQLLYCDRALLVPVKSVRITGAKAPLETTELPTPTPSGSQVLVRVKSSGVCHSDLHLWEGGYDMGDGKFMKVTDRGVKYPVTPGHEIAGTVEAVGPDASSVKVGQNVLVYPWLGCKECPACKVGNENLCDAPRSIGIFQDGGYADHVLVSDHSYLADIGDMNLDEATSLACSGLTAYTAVKKASVSCPPNIVIIGAGGLGLMGIQIAKAITDSSIICVDLDDKKLGIAKDMGADHIINSSSKEAAKEIIAACGGLGAESVIDFVNAPPTVGLALEVVRKRGSVTLVGLFGGSFSLSLVTVPLKSLIIQGAYTGSYKDMVELIGLAKKNAISPMISRRYSLDDANSALEDLRARKIIGRAVINP